MTPTPTTSIAAEVKEIPVDRLDPAPWNPRSSTDPAALAELTDSIRTRGILVPLIVRRNGRDRLQIIAGHRRHQAAQALDTCAKSARLANGHTSITFGTEATTPGDIMNESGPLGIVVWLPRERVKDLLAERARAATT